MKEPKISAENFLATVSVNVDNNRLSDKDFREFIRNSLPIVEYPRKKADKDDVSDETAQSPKW